MSVHSFSKYKHPLLLCEPGIDPKALKRLSPRLRELVNMHHYARPASSQTEEAFITDFITPLPGAYKDTYGNWIVKVGKEAPTVCWTSHTDTVAWYEGKQSLAFNEDGLLCLHPDSEASCLGADCTVGVWIMRRMILAGKPGLYIFHRDEESGGQGSSWIAENTPELLGGIQFCISLDRRGYTSVITDQIYGETASNAFALSIAPHLPFGFKPDDGGTFTDSAFYAEIVPECSNLSVGYHHQHSSHELQDIHFADDLLLCLLKLDYSKLVAERVPEPIESYAYGYAEKDEEPDFKHYREQWSEYLKGENDPDEGHERDAPELEAYVDHELLALVSRYPAAVALLLQQWDLGPHEVYKAVRELRSYV